MVVAEPPPLFAPVNLIPPYNHGGTSCVLDLNNDGENDVVCFVYKSYSSGSGNEVYSKATGLNGTKIARTSASPSTGSAKHDSLKLLVVPENTIITNSLDFVTNQSLWIAFEELPAPVGIAPFFLDNSNIGDTIQFVGKSSFETFWVQCYSENTDRLTVLNYGIGSFVGENPVIL